MLGTKVRLWGEELGLDDWFIACAGNVFPPLPLEPLVYRMGERVEGAAGHSGGPDREGR